MAQTKRTCPKCGNVITIESTMLTPSQLSEKWGIPTEKVRKFISTGQLRAVDFSLKPGGQRPRWKISIAAVDEFEKSRESKPPAPKIPRRRRQRKPTKKWF